MRDMLRCTTRLPLHAVRAPRCVGFNTSPPPFLSPGPPATARADTHTASLFTTATCAACDAKMEAGVAGGYGGQSCPICRVAVTSRVHGVRLP